MISYIEAIPAFSDNYIWVLRKNDSVVVVDPGDPNAVESYLKKKNLKLEAILITHHHYDHTGGVIKLNEKWNPEVYGPKGGHIQGIKRELSEKSIIKILDTEFVIFETPGHTLDHIVFFSETDKVLFSGDTLFSLGCGRVFEGSYEQMFNSLEKIKELPRSTKIYCGHEYTKNNAKFCIKIDKDNLKLKKRVKDVTNKTNLEEPTIPITLQEEIETNTFLRYDINKIKKTLELDNAPKVEVFKKLRILKDQF